MLEDIGEIKTYEDGEIVFREHSRGKHLFVIESGSVRLERHSIRERGDEVTTVAVMGPGEFFGEMAVFDKQPRSTEATADGDVTLRAISRKELLARVREQPDTALEFLAVLSRRIRDMDSLVENILLRERLEEGLYEELNAVRSRSWMSNR